MGKLLIVRHGKTEWNKLNMAQGRNDIPLNEDGILEAQELVKHINLENVDYCITSPLKRARQTAEILCTDKIPITYDTRLVERSFGLLEGTHIDKDFIKKQWDYKLNTNEYNIETIKECLARAGAFLNYINDYCYDDNVLVVSHGCLIKCLHYCIQGYDENADFQDFFPKNTTLYEYDIKRVLKK